jgi:hypothetical protein
MNYETTIICGFAPLHSHCEKRLDGERQFDSVSETFEGNERRGNLISLGNNGEFFKGCKTTPLQNQSREIASQLQQTYSSRFLALFQLRLAMTKGFGRRMYSNSSKIF